HGVETRGYPQARYSEQRWERLSGHSEAYGTPAFLDRKNRRCRHGHSIFPVRNDQLGAGTRPRAPPSRHSPTTPKRRLGKPLPPGVLGPVAARPHQHRQVVPYRDHGRPVGTGTVFLRRGRDRRTTMGHAGPETLGWSDSTHGHTGSRFPAAHSRYHTAQLVYRTRRGHHDRRRYPYHRPWSLFTRHPPTRGSKHRRMPHGLLPEPRPCHRGGRGDPGEEEPRAERLCASTQLVAVGRRPCAEPLGNTCAPGVCRWWRSPQLTTAPFHRQFREADRHRRLLVGGPRTHW